jgi:hypothetical protein
MIAAIPGDVNRPAVRLSIDESISIIAPGTDKVGAVWAISLETGKTLWKYDQRAGVFSLVSTGGGLVQSRFPWKGSSMYRWPRGRPASPTPHGA